MRTTATPQVDSAASTLWRCGGRDCGAGECEHEENELHRHASGPGPHYAPPLVHDVLRSGGSPLPPAVRAEMEGRLGGNFGDVRIHTDAAAGASALAVDAHAYTVGRQVVFAPGAFNTTTDKGRRLLAHELAHAAANVRETAPTSGRLRVSSPDDAGEQQAQQVSRRVGPLPAPAQSSQTTPPPRPDRKGHGSDAPESTVEGATPPPQERDDAEERQARLAAATGAPATGALGWELVKRHRWDALWFFCGEHPAGFSTDATLRATGYSDATHVSWFVRQGADKVYAPGGFDGPEITLHSSAGSRRADDVHIEVQESMADGSVVSHLGRLTVRKPHRLRQEWTSEHNTCPPWDAVGAGCPSLWSEINYRIFDNVGGTIVGATVNERFPGPAVADQANRWTAATVTSGSSWPDTNGTFSDNLYKCCGIPSPVPPADPHWGDKVYHEPHEFYVGSRTAGRGCRVQAHTLQFYRGFADHENIRSPAP